MSGQLTDDQRAALGDLLRRLREDRDFTVLQAAERTWMDRTRYGQLEKGWKPDKNAPGGRQPVNASRGLILQLVWGLDLNRDEQEELFAAAGYSDMTPRQLKPPTMVETSSLKSYSEDELSTLADTISMHRAERRLLAKRRDRYAQQRTERN